MSCLLSETILSVNEIKLFVADKNNKLHSGSEICPPRLDNGRKRNVSKVACMGRGELHACLFSIKPHPPSQFCTTANSSHNHQRVPKLSCSDHSSPVHQVNFVDMRTVRQSKQKGKVARALKEHRARLYIIRRCIVMLLCWHD
ncbi:unnamed protein product [Urochloa decumbens]|uniref:ROTUNDIFOLIA like 8 n=1 Tax=Urochloa decumbens TaxID=240449 RepID=A0ABC9EVX4_9POAL